MLIAKYSPRMEDISLELLIHIIRRDSLEVQSGETMYFPISSSILFLSSRVESSGGSGPLDPQAVQEATPCGQSGEQKNMILN